MSGSEIVKNIFFLAVLPSSILATIAMALTFGRVQQASLSVDKRDLDRFRGAYDELVRAENHHLLHSQLVLNVGRRRELGREIVEALGRDCDLVRITSSAVPGGVLPAFSKSKSLADLRSDFRNNSLAGTTSSLEQVSLLFPKEGDVHDALGRWRKKIRDVPSVKVELNIESNEQGRINVLATVFHGRELRAPLCFNSPETVFVKWSDWSQALRDLNLTGTSSKGDEYLFPKCDFVWLESFGVGKQFEELAISDARESLRSQISRSSSRLKEKQNDNLRHYVFFFSCLVFSIFLLAANSLKDASATMLVFSRSFSEHLDDTKKSTRCLATVIRCLLRWPCVGGLLCVMYSRYETVLISSFVLILGFWAS